jgi:hypothetical protein
VGRGFEDRFRDVERGREVCRTKVVRLGHIEKVDGADGVDGAIGAKAADDSEDCG